MLLILPTTQENLSFLIKYSLGQKNEVILIVMVQWDLMMEPKFVSLLYFAC